MVVCDRRLQSFNVVAVGPYRFNVVAAGPYRGGSGPRALICETDPERQLAGIGGGAGEGYAGVLDQLRRHVRVHKCCYVTLNSEGRGYQGT